MGLNDSFLGTSAILNIFSGLEGLSRDLESPESSEFLEFSFESTLQEFCYNTAVSQVNTRLTQSSRFQEFPQCVPIERNSKSEKRRSKLRMFSSLK